MGQRGILGFGIACAVGLALGSTGAKAQQTPCGAWEVEYTLSENLRLSDTPMGKGNGTYAVGPGRVVLRFEDVGGRPGGRVEMVSYGMREHFHIDSKAVFWGAHVTTDAETHATPGACGVAEGVLRGTTLDWSVPVRGYRTDGMIDCDGSLCGRFGAPPAGRSELHIGPDAVMLRPFQFSPDMKTFTMPETLTSKTQMPQQTASAAISGREVRRTCLPAQATCR